MGQRSSRRPVHVGCRYIEAKIGLLPIARHRLTAHSQHARVFVDVSVVIMLDKAEADSCAEQKYSYQEN